MVGVPKYSYKIKGFMSTESAIRNFSIVNESEFEKWNNIDRISLVSGSTSGKEFQQPKNL